jgi:hypothetical protein
VSPRAASRGPGIVWLLVILAVSLISCQVLDESERRKPDTLIEGRLLWMVNCDSCHEQVEPEFYSDADLTFVVRDMGRRAHLTPLESEKLLAFMQWANDIPRDQRDAELARRASGEPADAPGAPADTSAAAGP